MTTREHPVHGEFGGFVLGAMDFGSRLDEKESVALLDRYVDGGGTWIDTANCYAFWHHPSGVGGQSEQVIGAWLAARPGMRERVRISTKMRHQPTVPHRWPESAEGLSAPVIRGAIRDSLARLGTDHVDLYWAHADDRSVPLEESVGAFGELAGAGLVRRLGASNHMAWRVERARHTARELGVPGYTAMQLRHSYLRPRPGTPPAGGGHQLLTEESLDYVAGEPDLALWVYTPLLQGAYTREDRPLPEVYEHPGTTRRLAALAEVAEEAGATRNQVVLAWLNASGITPIVGVTRPEQLDEALGAAGVVLTGEQLERLDAPV